MRPKNFKFIFPMLAGILLFSCNRQKEENSSSKYVPGSRALYDSIVFADSVFFAAYNNCELEKMASFISEDIEFYHDKGGLMTLKDSIMEAIKNNICGKVTRKPVKGSFEVYPIAGYGAVEMGQHIFHNNREPEPAHPSIGKFVHTWKMEDGQWKLTRVISLH